MRACHARQYSRDEDRFVCTVQRCEDSPYICSRPCALRPIFRALAHGNYPEADLEKLVRLAQTENMGIDLIPVNLLDDLNEKRRAMEDYESRDLENINFFLRECEWVGCSNSKQPGSRAKYCHRHSRESIKQRRQIANKKYYDKNHKRKAA